MNRRPYVLARTLDVDLANKVVAYISRKIENIEVEVFQDGKCCCIQIKEEPSQPIKDMVKVLMEWEEKGY